MDDDEERGEDDANLVLVVDVTDAEALEPWSLAEAKCCSDWPEWERAIRAELKTLEDAGTWHLEVPPADGHIIGSKWVFHVKKDTLGRIVHHKARLHADRRCQLF
jgi:hypothetical protein